MLPCWDLNHGALKPKASVLPMSYTALTFGLMVIISLLVFYFFGSCDQLGLKVLT